MFPGLMAQTSKNEKADSLHVPAIIYRVEAVRLSLSNKYNFCGYVKFGAIL